MSIEQPLYGTTRTIPGDGDTDWGPEVREILRDLCKGLNGLSVLVANQAFLVLTPTVTTVTDSGSFAFSVATPRHDLKSTTGVNRVGSIVAGADSDDGQTALLVGHYDNDATNYAWLEQGSTSNIAINGNMQLTAGAAIYLMWDPSDASNKVWREISRSN